MQYFKGDDTEIKMDACAEPAMTELSEQKDDFFDGAYSCFLLGDLLYESNRSPLANAIDQTIFRESFFTIFEAFLVAGSFESYLVVFRKIFGDDVDVEFVVPGPGQLEINIEASEVILSDLLARYIEDNEYVFDEIVDWDGDNIAVQTIKGFQSQYELEQMLFEMVPTGIYTEISLTFG